MNRTICVYSSSSQKLDPLYYSLAEELGRRIAIGGDTLVFGAGMVGTMGATARGVKSMGGRIIGIIPEALNKKGIVYEECDELIVTPEMRSRKKLLDERSDVLIALPGGFGTLEELLEVITSKQLGYHTKPIVIFDPNGFYTDLLKQFEVFFEQNFANRSFATLYHVATTIDDIFEYIDNYTPHKVKDKWQ